MGSQTVAYSPLGSQIDSADELADGIITESKLAAGAVTVTKLGTDAVETAKIKDAQVTAAKLLGFVNLEFVGSDLVEGSIASSVSETTIGSVVVTGGTVTTGCLIVASLKQEAAGTGQNVEFRLKTGVAASEVERELMSFILLPNSKTGSVVAWYDTVANYAADVSIIVTGKNATSGAGRKCTCHSIIVYGH